MDREKEIENVETLVSNRERETEKDRERYIERESSICGGTYSV